MLLRTGAEISRMADIMCRMGSKTPGGYTDNYGYSYSQCVRELRHYQRLQKRKNNLPTRY